MSEEKKKPIPIFLDEQGNVLSKDKVENASKEAMNAPTLFNPRERSTYIRERVKEIRSLLALGQNDLQIKEALGSFVTEYPTLFQKAANPNFSPMELNMMLDIMDKMATKGMTQHQASVIVGQKLADTYIKPRLNGLPTKK